MNMEISLDSLPQTRKARRKKFLSPPLKSTIAVFWSYDDILLRHFYEVSKTGDLKSLIKSGDASEEQCAEVWEKIVQKNNYHSGSRQYDNYLNLIKQYNLAIREYNAVVSTIGCLEYVIDDEHISFLRSKGYKIDTSCGSGYKKSLEVARHESGRVRSKIKIKYNQILNFNQRAQENQEQSGDVSIDDMLTALSMEVGFQLPDSITLAQYNAYAKRVKKRNEERNKKRK